MIKKNIFIILIISSVLLYSDDLLIDFDNFDTIFDTEEEIDALVEDKSNILDDVINATGFTFGSTYSIYTGYSTGIINGTWIENQDEDDDIESSPLISMISTFSLDAQISSDFSVYQELNVYYDDADFDVEIQEFFAETILFEEVFLSFGMQDIRWGESTFNYTNLPNRYYDDFSGSTDSYSLKLSVPLGIGGLTLLALTREGFWEDKTVPASDEIAYGMKLNYILDLINQKFDINTGVFYYKDLNNRGFISLNTTILKKWDVFTEGLVSYDSNEKETLDISASIGCSTEFLNGNLGLAGEYFFNGEDTELEIDDDSFPLFHGHNLALQLSYRLDKINTLISNYLLYNYNNITTSQSGLFTPVVIWDITKNFMLSIASPLYFGDYDAGYVLENIDTLKRDFSIVIRLIYHGKI